jgi:hypothetical protein
MYGDWTDGDAIKSIEGYTVKAKSEQSGVNESKGNTQVNWNAEKNEDINFVSYPDSADR